MSETEKFTKPNEIRDRSDIEAQSERTMPIQNEQLENPLTILLLKF